MKSNKAKKNFIFPHQEIEKKWRNFWEQNKTYSFNINDPREKKYILDMFPYPSGSSLHVGHPRGYTATDIYSRMLHFQNFNVLHPMGFDAFGLPAEQFANQNNKSPHDFTQNNIQKFIKQLKLLGFYYDYDRIIDTTDPHYFKWTQWIFKQLYKKGLAILEKREVNYCPELHTVLANEEIYVENGQAYSERGDFKVEKRYLNQWSLKITKYADRLLEGLEDLNWPEGTKKLQRNWIGKQHGHVVKIKINQELIPIFIPNHRHLNQNGILYISVNHPQIKRFFDSNSSLQKFYNQWSNACDFEKHESWDTSSKLKLDITWNNPFSHQTVPIYVVANNLSKNNEQQVFFHIQEKITNHEIKINEYEKNGMKVKPITLYQIQDWLFSRQRYWGEPFPIYYSSDKKIHLMDDAELPLELPPISDKNKESISTNKNEIQAPLSFYPKWLQYKVNGKTFYRDTNTMPQWAGSCWYYIGYLLKVTNQEEYLPLNSKKAIELINRYLPVDLYVGGSEHSVLHLIYARFWHHVLYDIGITKQKEPFQKLIHQGMILDQNFKKMSKSKNNVVNPTEIISEYGADALRFYEMFLGPINSGLPWDSHGVAAARKFIDKVYKYFLKVKIVDDKDMQNKPEYEKQALFFNNLVQDVTLSFTNMKFNVGISKFMIFYNQIEKHQDLTRSFAEGFLIMFSCVCPFLCEELWYLIGHTKSILARTENIWPQVNLQKLKLDTVTVLLQHKKKIINVSKWNKKELNEDKIISSLKKQYPKILDQNYIFKKLKDRIIISIK